MSVGVEVDALALMLDGVVIDAMGESLRVGGAFSVDQLQREPSLSAMAQLSTWLDLADVAEAILELEGSADAWLGKSTCLPCSRLAQMAWKQAAKRDRGTGLDARKIGRRYLEAAAILRDGWRPKPQHKEAP
ncbi:MAG: hypothetical protein ACRCU1_02395 [Alsobacter sp.]